MCFILLLAVCLLSLALCFGVLGVSKRGAVRILSCWWLTSWAWDWLQARGTTDYTHAHKPPELSQFAASSKSKQLHPFAYIRSHANLRGIPFPLTCTVYFHRKRGLCKKGVPLTHRYKHSKVGACHLRWGDEWMLHHMERWCVHLRHQEKLLKPVMQN